MDPCIVIPAAVALFTAVSYAGMACGLTEGAISRLREPCMHGDGDACARRDGVIDEYEAEWRSHHPEWRR